MVVSGVNTVVSSVNTVVSGVNTVVSGVNMVVSSVTMVVSRLNTVFTDYAVYDKGKGSLTKGNPLVHQEIYRAIDKQA